jgi:uncharacterized protein YbjT (DUF2867 family)
MSEKTATIIGSTGMIGSHLLLLLLQDSYYDYIRILVRRPQPITNERLEVKLVNFSDWENVKLSLEGSDVVFSCIGGTMKNVLGDKDVYWKIDHDIPVNACTLALETGCRKFVYVSAMGANAESGNFYLQMKGQTQKDIIATGMPQIHIMEPGILLGKRKENRPFEKLAQAMMKPLSGLMFGSLSKYKAIDGADVARAMIAASKKDNDGVFVYRYDEMMKTIKDKDQ